MIVNEDLAAASGGWHAMLLVMFLPADMQLTAYYPDTAAQKNAAHKDITCWQACLA